MNDSVLALTEALIQRQSVTPEDAGCLELIAERLLRLGFDCERMDRGGVSNLWATIGAGQPTFTFAGHTDVVPTGPLDEWHTPPFEPVIRDGLLYGRGAADMKSSLAAMVVATEQFINQYGIPQNGALTFLLTSDEEGPAQHGTRFVMEELAKRNIHIDCCVVGEPSSTDKLADTVRNGRRGSLNVNVLVQGVQGHVAYPEQTVNPIHTLAPALAEWTATVWDQGNQNYPPTSLQVSNIHAGTGANNVVPGALELVANFRFSTEVTEEELRNRTEAIFARHGVDATFEWVLSGPPFVTNPGTFTALVAAASEEVLGYQPELSTSGGTSDGRFIAPTGTALVELGPINASIHKINEHVAVADLQPLADIYHSILRRVFAV